MNVKGYSKDILQELTGVLDKVNEAQAEALVEAILKADRVFLAGAGRSGLAVKAFAMRLMHMGLRVFVVGEMVTPAITAKDLLFIGSGSGATGSLVQMAEKAKKTDAAVALVTIQPDSPIGKMAQVVVQIPAPSPKVKAEVSAVSIQPMGSLFEQGQLLFYDAVILELMEKTGQKATEMFGRHANLE